MPRGGPDASCLDRLLETDRLEYLDRDDVDPEVKRSVVTALERTGEWFGNHEKFAHIALDEVADVPDPQILELGAGHGGLSAKLLEMHPTARLTVTDVEPESVAAIAAGAAGHRRPRDRARHGRHRDRRRRRLSSTSRCSRCRSTTCRRRWRRA